MRISHNFLDFVQFQGFCYFRKFAQFSEFYLVFDILIAVTDKRHFQSCSCLSNFRGFKGKRSNPQDVSTAQAESNQKSTQKFSNDGNFLENFKKQNQFSNDGSFLEQFKKMKEEPKIEPPVVKSEPEPSPSQQNDWYKAALARAKQIAHTMTSPTEIKTDPEAQNQPPKGMKIWKLEPV